MHFPLVHALILNFNGKQLLLETLASVVQITYPNFKIIVVDNGSSDGSQALVRAQYSEGILLENEKNLGFGEGNNVGMRYALEHGAEWVLLLNNDLTVAPDLLTHMMAVAMADATIGILGPKIYYHDQPETIWFAGGRINYWAGLTAHRGIREMDRGQYDRVEDTDYLTGCTMLIRREVLERVGLFDPIYFPAYTEDADLCVRAQRAGYRLLYAPQAKVWHKVSSSSGGGMSPFKTKLKVQHSLIFFKRYTRWYHWLTIPWSIAGLAFVFVVRELARGNWRIVSALLRGFARAPQKARKGF
ncbi:MAG: glycosyltransferase family 2 protein [candidate division KSB1 bacterium]